MTRIQVHFKAWFLYRRKRRDASRHVIGDAMGMRRGCDGDATEMQRGCDGDATGMRRGCDGDATGMRRRCDGDATGTLAIICKHDFCICPCQCHHYGDGYKSWHIYNSFDRRRRIPFASPMSAMCWEQHSSRNAGMLFIHHRSTNLTIIS